MKRWDIINALIKKNGYKSYLEIGVFEGMCRDKVEIEQKTTVDPDRKANNPTHRMTSDAFFAQNKEKFDIIFIDGLHHSEQVYKDIINSLNVLNEGGTIVCHDMLPTQEIIQRVPRMQGIWTGDCWKAWMYLRGTRKDLDMKVVNTDWGVGIIQRGKQEIVPKLNIPIQSMKWEFFVENKALMNIIEPEDL